MRGLQKATLDVSDGKPVDVGPILKDVVEAGQFNRGKAFKQLADGGLDSVQAEAFLTRWDGLAAAQGLDTDTWVKRHIADIEVGGEDGPGIRFHAAMYRNDVATVGKFVNQVRNNPKGKASFFELGQSHETGSVLLTSHAVNHIYKRHPGEADQAIPLIMDVLEGYDKKIEGDPRKNTYGGKSYIFVKNNGGISQAVAVETVSGKNGRKSYVTTTFMDSTKGVDNWVKAKEARLAPGGSPGSTQASHSESVVQIDTSFDESIHHRGEVRKVVERLQRKAKNAAPLKVVDTYAELPEHVKAKYRERQMVGGVRGVNDGQSVYIVADAFDSVDQAVAIWMHEQGVHHGLRGLIGDDAKFNTLMDSVYDHFGAENLEDIRQAYRLNFDNVAHRREAAEEMLAHIGEKLVQGGELTDMERSMWDQIKAWFAQFLRERGLDVELTDEDIAEIVKDAVRWTMDGQPGVSRKGPQRFSVNGKANGSVEFLPDGRAHVRLFNGADLDQAGESLSRILSERFNEFPPAERLDWRTERPERDLPDPMDDMESDEAFARDVEEVQAMAAAGRVTEQELAELKAADRGVEQAGRLSEAFRVAAECIIKGGV
ncbi:MULTISPECIES: hypothetical protein [unclassified Pseudodesulfovibrio]|uniref:hypothetical protein n=1 Tax=unclassified Pseudodesulfovibrio TaxID=2661612 RepID=UPI000FEBF135|nr:MULTISPECIES: hypothetical protein [unclassified Pseudodesulfovibrio]MCJ2165541.1 hypothetical protein [Pseudodesulfovibrio sp. S3-i]RWU03098.1 hypothetical protein DWB63_12900 [Pseudodesulfovibrio sp. S3]